MKPSIFSHFFNMLDIYSMPKAFIEAGYDCTEISEVHFMPFYYKEENVKQYKSYIDDLGFSIPQGHLVFLNKGNLATLDNTYAVDCLKRNLDVFYELGVKSAVLHYCNFGTDKDTVDKWADILVPALNKLISHIENTDMTICLENLSRRHDKDASQLLYLCKSVDCPKHIGICLDTGHLNISKKGDPYDFILQAGDFLKATHIHDNRGNTYDYEDSPCDLHDMPFDGGDVNWQAVRAGLKQIDYKGLFNYEVSTNAPLEIKKIQAKYLLECYKTYFKF